MFIDNPAKVEQWREQCLNREKKLKQKVIICFGPGCLACGCREVYDRFVEILGDERGLSVSLEAIKKTGCHGLCDKGPLVVIEPQAIFYTKVKPKQVDEIVERTLKNGEVIETLLYEDPITKKRTDKYKDIDFYRRQQRIALRNLGHIDPDSIDDYVSAGGYSSLAKTLSAMTPESVIDQVTESGLRGRGGGGFSAGKKWATCRNVQSDTRYVICNGDEGDPGAFMDRAIMEGDPHSVIEGMIICAYAVGSKQGYIYVREEYPLAIEHLGQAIIDAREAGLLGESIMGTDFSFEIQVNRGGGAFVCGESSALMRSVAGDVGEPRAKYIRSVIKGLFDMPTVLNNVETFANVPVIISNGPEWFRKIGTPKSTGTKAFSLVGKVRNTGLIEVAMGTTLREIIYGIGGGIPKDRPFKAVQTGGPSGGCIPESLLDLSVDFDTLTEAGSMMGSGGMIVMDSKTCMVDVARYFLHFLVSESCGKCVPCREGLYQLHELTQRVCDGKGAETDLEKMEKLSEMVVIGSLCGLGKSGPNPLLSTIKYFREEYLTHIRGKKCPAGVCRALITYTVIEEKCDGCMACIAACAYHAISGKKGVVHVIDQERCDKCGACVAVCKRDAIEVA